MTFSHTAKTTIIILIKMCQNHDERELSDDIKISGAHHIKFHILLNAKL
jgi:hypothetical protein